MRPMSLPVRGGKAFRELSPGGAAVFRLVDPPFGAARDLEPGVPPSLPGRGVDDVRVSRVEDHVADPGVVRNVEDMLPVGAPVGRLVEAAIAAGPPQRSLRGDPDGLAVARVEGDLADVFRLVEPHVLERSPGVAAPPDAVPVGHRPLAVVLAGSQPDDVRVGRIDHYRRGGIHRVVLEDRLPGGTAVRGLKSVSGGDRHVPGGRVVRIDGHVGDPPGTRRGPDTAEFQAGEEVLGDGRGFAFLGKRNRREQQCRDQEKCGASGWVHDGPQRVSVGDGQSAASETVEGIHCPLDGDQPLVGSQCAFRRAAARPRGRADLEVGVPVPGAPSGWSAVCGFAARRAAMPV